MKNLIVYYSYTSNNQLLATYLQEQLKCDILRIEERKKRTVFTIFFDRLFGRKPTIKGYNVHLSGYDHVILIAPVWIGRIASPLKSFLVKERDNIRSYSFISLCGGVEKQREKLVDELTKLIKRKPGAVEELWIADLLSDDERNIPKNTTEYRVSRNDLELFRSKIEEFIEASGIVAYH